jgi:hypothetical protein
MGRPRKVPEKTDLDKAVDALMDKTVDDIIIKLYRETRLCEDLKDLDYARIAGYAQGAAESLVSFRGIVAEEVNINEA